MERFSVAEIGFCGAAGEEPAELCSAWTDECVRPYTVRGAANVACSVLT